MNHRIKTYFSKENKGPRELVKITRNQYDDFLLHLDRGDIVQFTPRDKNSSPIPTPEIARVYSVAAGLPLMSHIKFNDPRTVIWGDLHIVTNTREMPASEGPTLFLCGELLKVERWERLDTPVTITTERDKVIYKRDKSGARFRDKKGVPVVIDREPQSVNTTDTQHDLRAHLTDGRTVLIERPFRARREAFPIELQKMGTHDGKSWCKCLYADGSEEIGCQYQIGSASIKNNSCLVITDEPGYLVITDKDGKRHKLKSDTIPASVIRVLNESDTPVPIGVLTKKTLCKHEVRAQTFKQHKPLFDAFILYDRANQEYSLKR